MNWAWLAFAALTGMVLYSGYRVVTAPRITHAALFLAAALAGVAGFFLMLNSEFLAVVQIMVYVGAVMTVIIFAIMLSDAKDDEPGDGRLLSQWLSPRFGALPLLVALAVLVLVLVGYGSVHWLGAPVGGAPGAEHAILHDTTQAGSTGTIGQALFTTYLVPFEVASLMLLAAMVGAIVLTKRDLVVRLRSGKDANATGPAPEPLGDSAPARPDEVAAATEPKGGAEA